MANPLSSQIPGDEEWLISAPAFTITKVQTAIGLFITAVLGAVPPSLEADPPIVIAAIAAGTLIVLGMLALVATDMRVRQQAEEAKLRYGEGKPKAGDDVLGVPTEQLRVIRSGSDEEYEIDELKMADGAARLVATRQGKSVSIPFDKSG